MVVRRAAVPLVAAAAAGGAYLALELALQARRPRKERLDYRFCVWYALSAGHPAQDLLRAVAADRAIGALPAAPAHVTHSTRYASAAEAAEAAAKLPETVRFRRRGLPIIGGGPFWLPPPGQLSALFVLVRPAEEHAELFPASAHLSIGYATGLCGAWAGWLAGRHLAEAEGAGLDESFIGRRCVVDVSSPDPSAWREAPTPAALIQPE